MRTCVPVAAGLHFPTSLVFDADGGMVVAESGLPFGGAPPGGRVWRVDPGGGRRLLAEGLAAPVTGLAWHKGWLFVSEGGAGRIVRLGDGGRRKVVVDGLPGPGDYHTNMPVVGRDGWLYFGQGAMTNAGIIGLDSYQLGWLGRLPETRDVPGYDVVLTGVAVRTVDPRKGRPAEAWVLTGGFAPFGGAHPAGHRIAGVAPASAAVLRCPLDGGAVELVAWGLRNAFGLGFLPDGRLLALDQGPDDRGSRPIGGAPDALYEVRPGGWYGWPDFVAGVPVTDPSLRPSRGSAPEFLLANHGELPAPERPLADFPPHAAATKFAVAPPGAGPFAGHLLVAVFGDEAPMTAPPGTGHRPGIMAVDPGGWSVRPLPVDGPHRPIDVAFRPGEDDVVYLLDFGQFAMTERGVRASAATGRVLRCPLAELT